MCPDKTNSATTTQVPTREEIQEQARTYLGTKWRHQGRNPDRGIDCAGLIALVAKNLGLSEYDSTNYHRNPLSDNFVRHFSSNMTRKRIVDRRMGDVVLFRDKTFSCHSAFITHKNGTEHIIHAYAKRKKVIEEPLTKDWISRMTYCFEFYGVTD